MALCLSAGVSGRAAQGERRGAAGRTHSSSACLSVRIALMAETAGGYHTLEAECPAPAGVGVRVVFQGLGRRPRGVGVLGVGCWVRRAEGGGREQRCERAQQDTGRRAGRDCLVAIAAGDVVWTPSGRGAWLSWSQE
jgi:hypothetical protein